MSDIKEIMRVKMHNEYAKDLKFIMSAIDLNKQSSIIGRGNSVKDHIVEVIAAGIAVAKGRGKELKKGLKDTNYYRIAKILQSPAGQSYKAFAKAVSKSTTLPSTRLCLIHGRFAWDFKFEIPEKQSYKNKEQEMKDEIIPDLKKNLENELLELVMPILERMDAIEKENKHLKEKIKHHTHATTFSAAMFHTETFDTPAPKNGNGSSETSQALTATKQ